MNFQKITIVMFASIFTTHAALADKLKHTFTCPESAPATELITWSLTGTSKKGFEGTIKYDVPSLTFQSGEISKTAAPEFVCVYKYDNDKRVEMKIKLPQKDCEQTDYHEVTCP